MKSATRPEHAANRMSGQGGCELGCPYGPEVHNTGGFPPLPFDDPVGPRTFPAFDGPAQCGIFPTDFSSTAPSADCLLAIADIAADPLSGSALFSVFLDMHRDSRRDVAKITTRRGIGKPLSSRAAFVPDRAVGSPGVLPAAFDM